MFSCLSINPYWPFNPTFANPSLKHKAKSYFGGITSSP